jgi:hypothetical protein
MKAAIFATTLMLGAQAFAAPLSIDFKVDSTQDRTPISPYIYGINGASVGTYNSPTFTRSGGNRMTAYNWTNNDSNAGSDWHFQNDGMLSKTTTPGDAVAGGLAAAQHGASGIVITIPMIGYVSADRRGDGDVRCFNGDARKPDHNYLNSRFKPEAPAKGKPFTTDATALQSASTVYQDEFVNWVNVTFPNPKAPIWYCLDNEPDLWSATHAEVHPARLTYSELIDKSIAYATAIKKVSPNTLIFGPVSYGWNGYVTLQDAPDAKTNGDFLTYYLAQLASASRKSHHLLVDVLDLHWYTEAQGGGARVGQNDSGLSGKKLHAVQNARMQAPRSLWDPTYTENSWITQRSLKGPIQLIPREQKKLAAAASTFGADFAIHDIAFTEYNYGGGDDISGAIAEADALGIFGKFGVLAAAEWGMNSNESFIGAGFRAFRNFDGNGANFGDTSISATSSDIDNASIYASTDSTDPNRVVVVLINRTDAGNPSAISVHLSLDRPFNTADLYQLTSAGAEPVHAGHPSVSGKSVHFTLPGDSIATLVLTGAPLSH